MEMPVKIKLGLVPAYIAEKYGRYVTRQTVYNWASKGKRGNILQTTRVAGTLFTTKGWISGFFSTLH